jgi:membrane protein DedA with SNARE-associated domain
VGQLVTNFVTSGGLAAIFVLMLVNQCGIPFPSEVTMPLAGYFAAQGHLNVVAVVVVAVVANLIGALIAYTVSRRFGEQVLLGPGRRLGISNSHVELANRAFARYGPAIALVGRFLPVVTTYVSFPAGVARMNPAAFALFTVIGSAIWCSALTAVGYAVGASYTKFSDPLGKAAIVLAVLVVIGVAVWYVRGRRGRQDMSAQRVAVSEDSPSSPSAR